MYHNADGTEAGAVGRWNLDYDTKTFGQVSRVDDDWITGGMSSPRPLYRLPDLIDAETVYVCEGEKAADAIRSLDLVGTSPSQGGKSPKLTGWKVLDGKRVVILPDNDADGEKFATSVADLIRQQAPTAAVEVKRLIDDWPEISTKGDAHDWSEFNNGADAETLRLRLEALPESGPALRQIFHSNEGQPPGPSYSQVDCNDIGNAAHFAKLNGDR